MSSDLGLGRNTLWNLLGQGAPLLAAVFAIPVLVAKLGTERFGVLSLIWMAIGYFSVFDLGLGRALTQLVAGKLDTPEEGELPPLVCTALYLMTLCGLLGMAILLGPPIRAKPGKDKHVRHAN